MDGRSPEDISYAVNGILHQYKAVACAIVASGISTFAGYPLDSLKSRLQTIKHPISVPSLAVLVYREEGVRGFYRGLWIPLVTITFVRAASFTIYSGTKDTLRDARIFNRDTPLDVSLLGGLGGALAGSLISFGSAPFELVKVRRQLEYSIAAAKGLRITRPPGTLEAVRDIMKTRGPLGLYTGFKLHFVRDTSGTALYFMEYDGMRHMLGRLPSGEQGPTPAWLPIHSSLVPFFCGSLSGVTSWALIYPMDVVKTKVQQRALAGDRYRGVIETLTRLIRGELLSQPFIAILKASYPPAFHNRPVFGFSSYPFPPPGSDTPSFHHWRNAKTSSILFAPGPDPQNPRTLLAGVSRLYRGLGVSAVRSITTHGLLWTFFDLVSNYIDHLPVR